MISGRMRHHAAPRGLFRKRKHRVSPPSNFERASLLKFLALKKKSRPGNGIKQLRGKHRRAMNVRSNAPAGSANVVEGDVRGHFVSFLQDATKFANEAFSLSGRKSRPFYFPPTVPVILLLVTFSLRSAARTEIVCSPGVKWRSASS